VLGDRSAVGGMEHKSPKKTLQQKTTKHMKFVIGWRSLSVHVSFRYGNVARSDTFLPEVQLHRYCTENGTYRCTNDSTQRGNSSYYNYMHEILILQLRKVKSRSSVR